MWASLLISKLEKALESVDPTSALFLSGGLDSAVLQALGGFQHTYCCTWPEENNITAARKAAGRHVNAVCSVTFDFEEMLAVLPEIARLTKGKGTWSQVCQWFMAARAKAERRGMVITGEGADELFGGYSRYRALYWRDRARYDPKLRDYQSIVNDVLSLPRINLTRLLSRKDPSYTCADASEPVSLVRAAMAHDRDVNLPPLLKNESAMISAHGLRPYYPYLVNGVVLHSLDLPYEQLINERESKVVLREVARRLGVHRDIIDESTKKGLFVPQSWRPKGTDLWSTGWFDDLMASAWRKVAPTSESDVNVHA